MRPPPHDITKQHPSSPPALSDNQMTPSWLYSVCAHVFNKEMEIKHGCLKEGHSNTEAGTKCLLMTKDSSIDVELLLYWRLHLCYALKSPAEYSFIRSVLSSLFRRHSHVGAAKKIKINKNKKHEITCKDAGSDETIANRLLKPL